MNPGGHVHIKGVLGLAKTLANIVLADEAIEPRQVMMGDAVLSLS